MSTLLTPTASITRQLKTSADSIYEGTYAISNELTFNASTVAVSVPSKNALSKADVVYLDKTAKFFGCRRLRQQAHHHSV